jgi:hypothetical protein
MNINKINTLFKYIFTYITLQLSLNTSTIYNINNYVNSLFTFINLNIYLLSSLISKLQIIYKNQKIHLKKITELYDKLDIIHINLLHEYNTISLTQDEENKIILEKPNKYIINNTNLDLYDLEDIDKLLQTDITLSNNPNFITEDYVDIGFNNYYKFSIYKDLNGDIPYNTLVYIKEINQVVIKVGDKTNYRYINSKLYKTYNIKNENNSKSIICNNNIKELNKKCNMPDCKFYHDYIIGYKDNADKNRQFSYNPIVYNCLDFKDGSKVKENTKKIKWFDAINLYQANLSCILIACMHSMNKS